MNPFQAHADNMAAYEIELEQPIAGMVGNSINAALWNSNGKTNPAANYPATISRFEIKQVFGNGGFSPRLMGQAIVRKSVLPAGTYFRTGDRLTAVQSGGSVRSCQIEDIEDQFTEYRLNLWDVNQGA